MLFRDPTSARPDDDAPAHDDADDATDDATAPLEGRVYCAACGHAVTRAAWALRIDGAHEHFCRNPLGIDFTVRLFRDADGAKPAGPPSNRATWFAGYTWRLAACANCREHLGWLYEGTDTPPVFFGLIKDAITDVKTGR